MFLLPICKTTQQFWRSIGCRHTLDKCWRFLPLQSASQEMNYLSALPVSRTWWLSHYFPASVIDAFFFFKGNFGSSYYLLLCILLSLHAMNYQILSILLFIFFSLTLPPPSLPLQSHWLCPLASLVPMPIVNAAITLNFPEQASIRSSSLAHSKPVNSSLFSTGLSQTFIMTIPIIFAIFASVCTVVYSIFIFKWIPLKKKKKASMYSERKLYL